MELAKVTTRGQITIPLAIRKKLGVKDGDKVVFLEREDGRIVIENSVMLDTNALLSAWALKGRKS
jgi:AbrB family looped-hinge helix DNA binding protein